MTDEIDNKAKNSTIYLAGAIILLIILVVAWFYLGKPETPQPAPLPQPTVTATATAQPTPSPLPTAATPVEEVIATPIPAPTATPPILNNSDQHVQNNVRKLNQGEQLLKLLTGDEILRKIVRAVHQLSEGNVVKQYRPIKSPAGLFRADKISEGDAETLATYSALEANTGRYDNYVAIIDNLDPSIIASLYRTYSPLLEQAYGELGLNKGSFDEALKKSIDLLLATPNVQDNYLLVRPSVMYRFADPSFERLPNAQKLMIRIGKDNRKKVVEFLEEVKAGL